MSTQHLLDEYHDLDAEHERLRSTLREHCDTIKVMERMAEIIERKRQIAAVVFNQPKINES